MDWNKIQTESDIKAIMELFGGFHDCCPREAHIWTETYVCSVGWVLGYRGDSSPHGSLVMVGKSHLTSSQHIFVCMFRPAIFAP